MCKNKSNQPCLTQKFDYQTCNEKKKQVSYHHEICVQSRRHSRAFPSSACVTFANVVHRWLVVLLSVRLCYAPYDCRSRYYTVNTWEFRYDSYGRTSSLCQTVCATMGTFFVVWLRTLYDSTMCPASPTFLFQIAIPGGRCRRRSLTRLP